jgi:hypothetical protein
MERNTLHAHTLPELLNRLDVLPPDARDWHLAIEGHWGLRYYTSEPSPSRWIAVGEAESSHQPAMGNEKDGVRHVLLIVGTGTTEAEAVHELMVRLTALRMS